MRPNANRRVRTLLALAAATTFWVAGAPVSASAEVTLSTSVSKIEPAGDDGRGEQEVSADAVVPGDRLRYRIRFANQGDLVVAAGRIVITNPVPDGTVYIAGSAGGAEAQVEYSTDGERFQAPGDTAPVAGASPGAVDAGADDGLDPAVPAPPAAADHAAESVREDAESVRHIRWTYERELAPGDAGEVHFDVRMR